VLHYHHSDTTRSVPVGITQPEALTKHTWKQGYHVTGAVRHIHLTPLGLCQYTRLVSIYGLFVDTEPEVA